MNEKIRELAEQSGFFPVPDETEWDWDYRAENARYERFAELIVKQCMKICEDQASLQSDAYRFDFVEHDTSETASQCATQIKQHFGIR